MVPFLEFSASVDLGAIGFLVMKHEGLLLGDESNPTRTGNGCAFKPS